MRKDAELAKKVLLDLNREIHNNTVYSDSRDTYSYVNAKVVTALILKEIKKLEEMQ
jgi:hypothetical protein